MSTIRQSTNVASSRIQHKLMSRLPWHITSAWQSLTWAKHSVSFNWHGAWYKPRVTICLFLIIARRGSNDQCQDNDLTSVLWAEAEQASLSFLIIARSGSNAQCQDNDLPQTFGPRRKEKSLSKTDSQSKWDAIYTRKSSCDLEIPIFFRCSNWLLLAWLSGDWLILNVSRTNR